METGIMNILSSLVLEIRCPSCGQDYEVSIANVLESQEMLNQGCASRGEAECPPLYLASLLDESDIHLLQAVLVRLASQAETHGANLRLAESAGEGRH
jgi:hypothetical protein